MADTTAAAAVASVAGSSGPVPLPLAGRVAIVTGTSRGIGRTIAAHLSALGASVVLGYASSAHLPALGASVVLGYASSAAEADTLAAELPRAMAVRADVSEEAGVRSQFDAAESALGCAAPHILVANAGVLDDKYPSVADTATADFERVLAVNTRGAFLCLGEAGRRQEEAEPVQKNQGREDLEAGVEKLKLVIREALNRAHG